MIELQPNPNTEKYLFEDYNLIEDTTLLRSCEDIEQFFIESIELLGNRYSGYTDNDTFIVKIDDLFYKVDVKASMYSGNNDDWDCEVDSVEYVLIDKPLPLERKRYVLQVTATESYIGYLKGFLEKGVYDFNFIEQ